MKRDFTTTDAFLPLWLAQALGYELFAIVTGRETISACFWRRAGQYPLIPFLAGITLGHLVWQQYIAPAQVAAAVQEATK